MKMKTTRYLSIVLALLLAVLTVFGCSSADTAAGNDFSYAYDAEKGMVASSPASTENTSEQTESVAEGRKLIKNANLTIETLEYDTALSALKDRCTEYGGYIQSASEDGVNMYSDGVRHATVAMRIPADRLDDFIAAAADLGNVISNYVETEDVTDSYFDVEARLEAYQIQEERYLALLQKADSMEDVIQLEQALTDVRYSIESLTGTLRKYDSLISYSTVTVYLREVYDLTEQGTNSGSTLGEKIAEKFGASLKAFGKFFEFLLLALVTTWPFLLLFGGIAVLVIFLVRRRNKKRAAPAPQTTAEIPPHGDRDKN